MAVIVQSQFDFEYSVPTRSSASASEVNQRLLSTESPSQLMSTTQAVATTSPETVLKKLSDVASFLLAKGADEEDEYAREGRGVPYLSSTTTSSPSSTVIMFRTTLASEKDLSGISTAVVSTTTTTQPTSTYYAYVRTGSFILFNFILVTF